MSNSPDPPTSEPRPLVSVPVAPHGHQIQPQHRTVLPAEDQQARSLLAEILAPAGGPPEADRLAPLSRLCGQYPAFLDGWARLAEAAYAGGDPVACYAFARVGYHRGLDRLRRSGWGGTGQVLWAEPSNRGFLRSLFLLMLAAASIGEEDEASRCRQFLLDLDPDDGLGVGARPTVVLGQMAGLTELP
ncbi:MAG TPA: DUF3151 family protein [Candidatus Dormibacteraeota bacterium]|nr:DUF3151 family protein [Candidatus Dormibacteraeota bacterium]